ncbi:MAG: KpsF/GutQ family sugar-phosphate isomerase [Desulfovibrio sp.]|nr:KpsF/GutQ family sugar-phosphate isomerase [Desulfovibrio sp.]
MSSTARIPTDVQGELSFAASVLQNEAKALSLMAQALDATFSAAVDCLAGVTGRIAVTGVGKSGLVGRKVAATLASTGSPAYFIHACEASHGDMGMLKSGDVVLAFSKSGNTAELLPILEHAGRRGIPVLAVTSRKDSPLGRHATTLLLFPMLHEADPMDCAPTTSTTLQMALGDALALALMRRHGITPEEFHCLHPGGALGRKLLTVGEIMHTGQNLPLVDSRTLMTEALMQMTGKGFGVVGVLDDEGRLMGIITDGDLRRAMGADLFTRQVTCVMHNLPVTVDENTLVTAALRTMQEKKITTLFVTRDEIPVGIFNVHDCLRAGVQ